LSRKLEGTKTRKGKNRCYSYGAPYR